MNQTSEKQYSGQVEGYVYNSYGDLKYLKHVVASVVTLRRYDKNRPVAIVCDQGHQNYIQQYGLESYFDIVETLQPDHRSIVGFKHNTHQYMLFDRNMFLDSDMIWCRNPDRLWKSLDIYDYTVTGNLLADAFFGVYRKSSLLLDLLFNRRKKTLQRFGLTYLSRVQSGIIYASDHETTKRVNQEAQYFLSQTDRTHFKSRKLEKGRNQETCEWSLAMAMSKLDVPIYPWHKGHESSQLDYVSEIVEHDEDFTNISYTYYNDPLVDSLKATPNPTIRKLFRSLLSLLPGRGDYMRVTPYLLHFGFYKEKGPFFSFAERVWDRLRSAAIEQKVTE